MNLFRGYGSTHPGGHGGLLRINPIFNSITRSFEKKNMDGEGKKVLAKNVQTATEILSNTLKDGKKKLKTGMKRKLLEDPNDIDKLGVEKVDDSEVKKVKKIKKKVKNINKKRKRKKEE